MEQNNKDLCKYCVKNCNGCYISGVYPKPITANCQRFKNKALAEEKGSG